MIEWFENLPYSFKRRASPDETRPRCVRVLPMCRFIEGVDKRSRRVFVHEDELPTQPRLARANSFVPLRVVLRIRWIRWIRRVSSGSIVREVPTNLV